LTYESSTTQLRFEPRTHQDQPGNVQYDLMPTSVTWTVSGTKRECRVTGQMTVIIPLRRDQPIDATLFAYGYMNVVGGDSGDFHSIMVSAFDPAAKKKVACPGKPPEYEPFDSAYLLHIISQPNNQIAGGLVFKGTQTFDPGRVQGGLDTSPADTLAALTTGPGASLIPPGLITPEIQAKLREAQAGLEKVAAERSGKIVYDFQWDLRP